MLFLENYLGLYCVMCFEVTYDFFLKHKIDAQIGRHFYCHNCGFRKDQGDSKE